MTASRATIQWRGLLVVLAIWSAFAGQVRAEANLNGQTGLIYMPDGRIDPDGTWRLGMSYADPYLSAWSSISLFPFLEVSGKFTQVQGVAGFPNSPYTSSYGDYKDKAASLKLRLLNEGSWWPSVAVGVQDFFGTDLYRAEFLAASKRIDDFDFTIGYGQKRIDGVFGGVRYSVPLVPGLSVLAEYNATDYSHDPFATTTGIADRKKGPVGGLEYRWKWLGLQASYGQDTYGVNAYLSVPLQEKEFLPKIHEPEPYTLIAPRPTLAQWNSDPSHRRRMVRALLEQNFRNIRIGVQGTAVRVELTNTRISLVSRAVGRAARTILLTSPIETREIEIVYSVYDLPFVTYTFSDVRALQRYFNGMITREQLSEKVSLRYASPSRAEATEDRTAMLDGFDENYRVTVIDDREGDIVSLRSEGAGLSKIKINPKINFFFNDPSGALRYDVYLLGSYRTEVLRRLFFDAALRVQLLEDVSQVNNPSNSALPHVRTDIDKYYRERGIVSLERLMLNRVFIPATRVYARASAGYYEMMYGGGGGQILYLPESGKWGVDFSADWVKQRDFNGGFGFQDYSTVTALASLHVKLPYLSSTTATVRAGRFLAKDNGARFELKRRFDSGFEFGFWYTRTDGNDITSPGSPGSPYYDKGVFINIPMSPFLTKDSQWVGGIALSPWTRDVGQMVASPADLYSMFELQMLNVTDRDGMVRFGDVDDNYATSPKLH